MPIPLLKNNFSPHFVPPYLSKENLPTMYDLPSENQEEPGLPDDFHYHQPQLLRETFCPPDYPPEQIYIATDLNLYYDFEHPERYKRPDWFAVLGVPYLYHKHDMRLSYVVWQEEVAPFIVIELLSEGTEKEDLGKNIQNIKKPPRKWDVYEQWLQIPYYVVFGREEDTFRAFRWVSGRYRELPINRKRLWIPEIELGLGLWEGDYHRIQHRWLRWYDQTGWITTPVEKEHQKAMQEKQRAEQAESRILQEKQRTAQEKQRADLEKQRAEQLAAQLRALGVEPNV